MGVRGVGVNTDYSANNLTTLFQTSAVREAAAFEANNFIKINVAGCIIGLVNSSIYWFLALGLIAYALAAFVLKWSGGPGAIFSIFTVIQLMCLLILSFTFAECATDLIFSGTKVQVITYPLLLPYIAYVLALLFLGYRRAKGSNVPESSD